MSAPSAGALRSRPSPAGPTARMSRAKIGSSAVAPPNSTQNRSSEIAPSTASVRQMKRTPPSTAVHDSGSALVPLLRREPARGDERGGLHQRRDDERHGRPGEIEEPAERRPDDHRHLRGERVLRRAAREDSRRHQRRQPRLHRRLLERAAGAIAGDRRRRSRPPSPAPVSARSASARLHSTSTASAAHDDGAPRIAVDHVSGDEASPANGTNCTSPMRPRSKALPVSA